jgi:hypothetical protein
MGTVGVNVKTDGINMKTAGVKIKAVGANVGMILSERRYSFCG